MKSANAREYINEIIGDLLDIKYEDQLTDLIIWAYDKGWEEGREDMREEQLNSIDD